MNLLDALFQWLLAASLRASVVAIAVMALRFLLRVWLPPWWRHALWLPVVLVLVLPVLPVVRWSPLPVAKESPLRVDAPSTAMPEAALPVAAQDNALPAPEPSFTTMEVLAMVWLVGACACLGLGIIGYRKSLARMERSAVAPGLELVHLVELAVAKVGLKRTPRILMSPEVQSPAVTGLLRPVLLLPAGFPADLSHHEARMVILHELTHLKRRDLPVNWLLCLLQAMHWFNPILWIAFTRLRADREAACDAQVLALDSTDHRADYGHALLKLQGATRPFGHGLAFVGFFKRGNDLHARIREISRYRQTHPAWNVAAAAIVGVCTVLGITKAEPPAATPTPGEATAKEAAAVSSVQQAVENRMKQIVFPAVNFEDVSLEEAVEYFRLRSVELDTTEKDSTRKGINMVVMIPKKATMPRIKALRLRNVPLSVALKYMCEATRMMYRVDETGSVIFVPQVLAAGAGGAEVKPNDPAAASSGQAYLNAKLKAILIPAIKFDDVSLEEAIEFLRLRSVDLDAAEKDPTRKGVNFVLRHPAAGEGGPKEDFPRINSLQLKNVSLAAALKYITDLTDMTCTVDDYAVTLAPRKAATK
ncbi:MAG: M56 family metallopeptidase [Luteolibacter sp.]